VTTYSVGLTKGFHHRVGEDRIVSRLVLADHVRSVTIEHDARRRGAWDSAMYRMLPTKALPRTSPNRAVVMSKRKTVSPLTGKNSFAAWRKAIACIPSGMNPNVS